MSKGDDLPAMLHVEVRRRCDGSTILWCGRPDGSVTWQRQDKYAEHFVFHDLTHYAVETVLGYKHGFFGLIRDGWDIEDTTGKGRRGPLPGEASEVEQIVGLFDSERGSGQLWSLEEWNEYAPRELTEEQVRQIRERRGELFGQWMGVASGSALRLEFGVGEG